MAWKKININSPDGNIFAILGYLRNLKKQLDKEGIDTFAYDRILKDYRKMSYDEILDNIEDVTNGLIIFTKNKDKDFVRLQEEEVDEESEVQIHPKVPEYQKLMTHLGIKDDK